MNSGDGSVSPLPRNSSWSDYAPSRLPARCQLFLPLVRNPRVCLVCGGARSQHPSHHPSLGENNPESRPLTCPYDVRAEFVPKSSWKVKFGPRIPIVLGDDNYVTLGERNGSEAVSAPLTLSTDSVTQAGQGPLSDSQVLKRAKAGPNSAAKLLDMLRNPVLLSPSASSAFEDYRILKAKNSPEGNERKNRGSVQFKGEGDSVIGCDGGVEYYEMSENEVSSLSSDSPSEHDYDNLTADRGLEAKEDCENTDIECEETHKNTEFNSDQKNFQLAPASADANGKSQECGKRGKCLGSVEREIDREIDKILGTSHKLQSIEGKLKDCPALSDNNLLDPVAPKAVKPPLLLTHPETKSQFLTPLMKSQSEIGAPNYTLSINKHENKTTISIEENDEMRPRSAKPDFVPPLILREQEVTNGDDSLAESSQRYSVSPSPGRELSEASSNLSTERRVTPPRRLVVKEMVPTNPTPKRKINKVDEVVEERLRTMGQDGRKAEKSVAFAQTDSVAFLRDPATEGKLQKKRPAPVPPTGQSHQNGYPDKKQPSLMQKSMSSSSVPRLLNGKFNNFDETFIDIGVCKGLHTN